MDSTVGVDLASQDRNTALCVIEWRGPQPRIDALELGVGDARILEAIGGQGVVKAAIDAPFGWPDDFVAAVTQHHHGSGFPTEPGDTDGRRRFSLRATDRYVKCQTGKLPLSVSTDKIAYPALRCAALLAALRKTHGDRIDRSGDGLVAEVYPGAALRVWRAALGITDSYKGAGDAAAGNREQIAHAVFAAFGLGDAERDRCAGDDDLLDAVVCALLARVIADGQAEPVPDGFAEQAAREGWIRLPALDAGGRLDATAAHPRDCPDCRW